MNEWMNEWNILFLSNLNAWVEDEPTSSGGGVTAAALTTTLGPISRRGIDLEG